MTKQKHFYLIRGLIREKGHWGSFIGHLQELFPKARITTLEIPGAGDYYQSPTPPSIPAIVEHMRRDYLEASSGQEEAYLIAISLGGMIAVEWMNKHPHDFKQATLINTSFGGISPMIHRFSPRAFAFLLKTVILEGRKKESRILELVTNHREIFNETLDMWEKIRKERPVSFSNTIRQLVAAARFKVKEFSPPIPVCILTATHDRMVSVNCSRSIAKKWNLPIQEHPTAGHDLTVDDPAWVAKMIKETTY